MCWGKGGGGGFSYTAVSRAPLQQLAGTTASSQTTQSKTSSGQFPSSVCFESSARLLH